MRVLREGYVIGSDKMLDYIAGVEFDTIDDIAQDFSVSSRTIGRRLASLRKDNKLVVHRYAGNEFIYMLGDDAVMNWDKYEALAIYEHRHKDDVVDCRVKECFPSVGEALEVEPCVELDFIIDRLVDSGFNV